MAISLENTDSMTGICKYCEGCLRLESEDFKSVYRCNDFIPMIANWKKLIEEELKNEKEQREQRKKR